VITIIDINIQAEDTGGKKKRVFFPAEVDLFFSERSISSVSGSPPP
jgi:hypothetical protein